MNDQCNTQRRYWVMDITMTISGLLRLVGKCCVLSVLMISMQLMAHTRLVDSDPADGVTMASGPERITLRYSKSLEVRYSVFSLHHLGYTPDAPPAAANTVAIGPAMVQDGNRTVVLPIEADLVSGRYALHWEVLATDGHTSRGVLHFLLAE